MTEIVVSHYREDLRWLKNVPSSLRLTVYYKDQVPDLSFLRRRVETIALPNIGREAHTWLTHLICRYTSPADRTVFLQGRPFDHLQDTLALLKALALGVPPQDHPEAFEWWGFIQDTDDRWGHRLFVPWSKNPERREIDIRRAHYDLFGEEGPEEYRFVPGGQFSVTAERWQSRPLSFYEKALAYCLSDPDAPYTLERMWDRLFGFPPLDETTMQGQQTRYLKNIKTLGLTQRPTP
ncbi:MAG: DUF3431 domain-containing protein [Candidatus Methylacidiphilales bacterium]